MLNTSNITHNVINTCISNELTNTTKCVPSEGTPFCTIAQKRVAGTTWFAFCLANGREHKGPYPVLELVGVLLMC